MAAYLRELGTRHVYVGLHPSALTYLSLSLWPHLDSFLGAMSSTLFSVARLFLAGSPLLPRPAPSPCHGVIHFCRAPGSTQGCAVSLLSDSWEVLLEIYMSHKRVGPF